MKLNKGASYLEMAVKRYYMPNSCRTKVNYQPPDQSGKLAAVKYRKSDVLKIS